MAVISVQVKQQGPSTSQASIRQHQVLIDRPQAKGGEDKGAMGGELLLAGLGGCFMSTLLAAIKAREEPVSNVQIEVKGTVVEAPPRFSAIEMFVSADHTDADLMQKLVTIAERSCIVANTLRGAVELTVHISTGTPTI